MKKGPESGHSLTETLERCGRGFFMTIPTYIRSPSSDCIDRRHFCAISKLRQERDRIAFGSQQKRDRISFTSWLNRSHMGKGTPLQTASRLCRCERAKASLLHRCKKMLWAWGFIPKRVKLNLSYEISFYINWKTSTAGHRRQKA